MKICHGRKIAVAGLKCDWSDFRPTTGVQGPDLEGIALTLELPSRSAGFGRELQRRFRRQTRRRKHGMADSPPKSRTIRSLMLLILTSFIGVVNRCCL